MTTQLDVANQALARLAVGKTIGAMSEATEAARIMTQFYNQARDETFRVYDWPFATTFATLVNVAGPSPRASVDWLYSYRYPANAVRARRLRTQPRRPDVRAARVPFVVAQDATGLLVLTDAAPVDAAGDFPAFPEIEYTTAMAESVWPADFAAAVSALLAWYAAPALTVGDPAKLGPRAYAEYDRLVRQAMQTGFTEREDDIDDPESAFLDARD